MFKVQLLVAQSSGKTQTCMLQFRVTFVHNISTNLQYSNVFKIKPKEFPMMIYFRPMSFVSGDMGPEKREKLVLFRRPLSLEH